MLQLLPAPNTPVLGQHKLGRKQTMGTSPVVKSSRSGDRSSQKKKRKHSDSSVHNEESTLDSSDSSHSLDQPTRKTNKASKRKVASSGEEEGVTNKKKTANSGGDVQEGDIALVKKQKAEPRGKKLAQKNRLAAATATATGNTSMMLEKQEKVEEDKAKAKAKGKEKGRSSSSHEGAVKKPKKRSRSAATPSSEHTSAHQLLAAAESVEWTSDAIKILKSAHRKCPVNAVDFWERVTTECNHQLKKKHKQSRERSVEECQSQWFKVQERGWERGILLYFMFTDFVLVDV